VSLFRLLWIKFAGFAAAASFLCAALAGAQIQVDTLSPASAYDAGLITPAQGGLEPHLWQSTSAQTATALIGALGEEALKDGPTRGFVRAALLSGGVPPQAEDGAGRDIYQAARLRAVLNLFGTEAYDQLSAQTTLSQNTPVFERLLAERALLGGDSAQACVQSDRQITERGAVYWAKLRAYCHFVRGELSAAELTADLIKRGDHTDTGFFILLGNLTGSQIKPAKTKDIISPLHMAMARDVFRAEPPKKTAPSRLPLPLAAMIAVDEGFSPQLRLAAMGRALPLLSSRQLDAILTGFSEAGLEPLTQMDRKARWEPSDWGQVYTSIKIAPDTAASTALITAMLEKSEKIGGLTTFSRLLATDIARLPAQNQADANPQLFARLAVARDDIGGLQALHRALAQDDKLRVRIALAADALGGGFLSGELGLDIETRLAGKGATKTRAVRDTYLAASLGAGLNPATTTVISAARKAKGKALAPGDFLILKTIARRGAHGEIALRTASILDGGSLSTLNDQALAQLLFIFREAGMADMAGAVAAEDFIGQ